MPLTVSVVFSLITEVISTTMGLAFYYFLFWMFFLRKPGKPKEVRANEHVYYPVRFYIPILKILGVYSALMIIKVSLKLWIQGYWAGGRDVVIVCAVYGLIILFIPTEKNVKRVIVNTEGITLECRVGGNIHYAAKQYMGYEGIHLYFEDPSGIRKTVKLRRWCREDRFAIVQDLNMLKQTGKLTGATATNAEEERRKANQQFLEEKQKLYADTKRYEAYLKEEASKRLSTSQKQDLVRMLQSGDKMNAIKQCREWTGLGLKEAKDVVEHYQICLLEEGDRKGGESLKVSHDLVTAYQTYLVAGGQREEAPVNRGSFSWKWNISGKEQEYSEQKSLESTMDQLLSDLTMKREESVTLIPPAPLLGIVCVRACLDPQGIMFRVEVEFVEHDAQGNPKILFKNGLMSWDVRDIFVNFRRSAKVETDGWQQIREK
jgi:ribosomal protein L7/L12